MTEQLNTPYGLLTSFIHSFIHAENNNEIDKLCYVHRFLSCKRQSKVDGIRNVLLEGAILAHTCPMSRIHLENATPRLKHIAKADNPSIYPDEHTLFSASNKARGFAPTISSTFFPPLKKKNVGMARTPRACVTAGTSSTSTLMKCTLSLNAASSEYLAHESQKR